MSEETVEVENAEAAPVERDYESEAKNLGWHNPSDDDFRGDPDKALGAEEFVKRGETELPLIRANNKKLQKQVNDLESGREEFQAYMEGQMKRQEAEFERRQREAVKDGDMEAFDQVAKERTAATPKAAPVDVNVQTAVGEFQARNTWYGVDDQMTKYAVFMDNQIGAQNLALSPEQHFKKVEEAVMNQFPKQSPRKTAPVAVEGARKRPSGGTAKTYEAMPQVDRAACDRMAKKWNVDKKDFVNNYWADQEKKA